MLRHTAKGHGKRKQPDHQTNVFETFNYDVSRFYSALTLGAIPDQLLEWNTSLDNALDLKSFTHHETLSTDEITYTILINTDPAVGVEIDEEDNTIDINPASNTEAESDVTIQATDGLGNSVLSTFHVSVQRPRVTTINIASLPILETNQTHKIDIDMYDQWERLITGPVTLTAETTLGSLSQITLTTTSGKVSVFFLSGDTEGTAIVTLQVGDATIMIEIEIIGSASANQQETPVPEGTPIPTPTPISTINNSSPSTAEDDPEPNDTCAEARLISPDGVFHENKFAQSGDRDWFTFIAPTIGDYRVEVIVPAGSQADIDLFYYNQCDEIAIDKFTETFAPGVQLDIEAELDGQQFYIKLKNFDDSQGGDDFNYLLSVRQLRNHTDSAENRQLLGPAIIVAGRYRYRDTLQDNINRTALAAYNLFNRKGRTDNDIYFLATDSSLRGYDNEATTENLRLGITQWAKERLDGNNVQKVLSLYLVDHGGSDEFYLDRTQNEVLTSNDLDEWLDELEDTFPELKVNVIIEACRAGSFIDRHDGSISKPRRVIITSSNESYDAYTSLYGAVFSDTFLTLLMHEHNLAYSFQETRNRVQTDYASQQPWIDANGNGEPNELDDLSLASLRGFGESGTFIDHWPPYIAKVYYDSETTLFHAEVRHQHNSQAIEDVWGIVYSPTRVSPAGQTDSETDGELNVEPVDNIEFVQQNRALGTEYIGEYHGFTEPGVYRIVVQSRDTYSLYAQPVTIEVHVPYRAFLPIISR
ncbi:MAG: C13 family peptidase [Chloroflexota bacterium]